MPCYELDWGPYSGLTEPTITRRNIFELTYDVTTITLPAPQFGDRHETSPREIKREDIRRNWISYKDPGWVSIEIFRFQFDNLARSVADAYLAFIVTSLGRPIEVTDHNTVTYDAILLEPQAPIGYFGNGNECKNTAEVILRWLP